MGIKPGDLVVNTRQINELTDQIKYNTDCTVLKLILDEHLDSVRDLFDDIIAEQKELIDKYLPISQIPSANPVAIVKWIKKQVVANVSPQLAAAVLYTVALIQLGRAIARLKSAIADAVQRLPECALDLKDHVLDTLEREVDLLINESLANVKQAQDTMIDIIQSEVEVTIDAIVTGTVEAFEETYQQGLQSIQSANEQLQAVDVDIPPEE